MKTTTYDLDTTDGMHDLGAGRPMNYDLDTTDGMFNSVAWFVQHVNHIKDGGVWVIPRSGAAYRVYHDRQCITCLEGPSDAPTERVAREAGWEVFS